MKGYIVTKNCELDLEGGMSMIYQMDEVFVPELKMRFGRGSRFSPEDIYVGSKTFAEFPFNELMKRHRDALREVEIDDAYIQKIVELKKGVKNLQSGVEDLYQSIGVQL